MRAYSQDLRDKVLDQYINSDKTMMAISQLFGICYETVRDWVGRYKQGGDYSSKQGVGCGRSIRFSDRSKILKWLESHPDVNAVELRDAVASELPMSTFYDTLARLGITYKKKNQNTKREAQWQEKRF